MRFNVKRYKILLMRLSLSILAFFFLINCKGQIPPPPKVLPAPEVVLPWYDEDRDYETTLNWYQENYSFTKKNSLSKIKRLSQVRETFYIKNGKLYNQANAVVNKTMINYYMDKSVRLSIVINDGVPLSDYFYHIKEIYPHCSQDDARQSLSSHLKIFKEGNGKWRGYYYRVFPNNYFETQLREEGEVKNHLKYGEWIYYSSRGVIDSTKTYFTTDSIEVRFPHCLFNKNEPCYSEDKTIIIKESVNKIIEKEKDVTIPFSLVEEAPKFAECTEESKTLNKACFKNKIENFFKNEIKKGNLKLKEKVRVLIVLTILKSGIIKDVKVRANIQQVEDEIIKIAEKLPKIKAGKQGGKAVNVTYQSFIYFE